MAPAPNQRARRNAVDSGAYRHRSSGTVAATSSQILGRINEATPAANPAPAAAGEDGRIRRKTGSVHQNVAGTSLIGCGD